MTATILRICAALLGLSLMIGETIRSWGQDRNPIFVVDDFFIGGFLLISAAYFSQDTPVRRAAFAGGWAFCAGMLYPSFFGKVFPDPSSSMMTNIDPGLLTALIGIAFLTSILGLIATLSLKSQ
jgi:hypothetical protein